MSHYPPSILNLIKHLARFPGIGEKTAERLAMHILKMPRNEAEQLAHSIMALKESIQLCSMCFALSDTRVCKICSDGPDEIHFRELVERVKSGHVKEVVLATSTSVEGEATANFIAERLAQFEIKVTRIASGVPIGGDLKYVDQVTLQRAMETRHAL